MYQERPSAVAGAVVWQRPASGVARRVRCILPDGCLDIVWANGHLMVAGPDTTAKLADVQPAVSYAGVRFGPGTGPAVIGAPADELRDRRVPLDEVWPARPVRDLADRIAAAADPGAVLEAAAARRRRRADLVDDLAPAILARLRAGLPVARTASIVGLSERQLYRRCLVAFGYGPKTLVRILRMRRAVALARAGRAFADVSATTGYADQAHLAREMKTLAGVPLGQLLRDEAEDQSGANRSTPLPSGSRMVA